MTQCERLLEYLNKHDSITQIEALNELGIMRLASRVSELNRQGYNIQSKMIVVKNRWGESCCIASYRLGDRDGA